MLPVCVTYANDWECSSGVDMLVFEFLILIASLMAPFSFYIAQLLTRTLLRGGALCGE